MKKTFSLILALIFVLSLAGTALAAPANPFVDVPAKHWAYDAVAKLAKAGIVDGYGDGTFRGDRTMTRYEMAQAVAKSMARSDKADAEMKALIDKLAVEFAAELNNLGVRVAKLEEKTRIGWNFESRIRYGSDSEKTNSGTNNFDWRQRIYLHGDVNENVAYGARLAAGDSKFGATGTQNVGFDQAYFDVKNFLGAFDCLTIGRLDTRGATNGLLNGKEANNDGLKVVKKFGDVKFTGIWTVQGTVSNYQSIVANNSEFGLANIDFNLGSNTKVNLGYQAAHFNYFSAQNVPSSYAWNPARTRSKDIGIQHKLGDFHLTGEYVKTDYQVTVNSYHANLNAYALQFSNGETGYLYPTYNLVDPKKAHSDAFAISYRKIQVNAVPLMSAFANFAPAMINFVNTDSDVKGFLFAYQNVVSKNVVWTVEYQKLKTDDFEMKRNLKDNVWATSFQFFF